MFLIAIVIVYFEYMSMIVGLLLNSCNCSYSVYLIDRWVDGRQYVDVVSRYLVYVRVHRNVPGHVVVRVGDSCVGSSEVHLLHIGLAWVRSRRR